MDGVWIAIAVAVVFIVPLVATAARSRRRQPTVGPAGELEMRFPAALRGFAALLAFAAPTACTIPVFLGMAPEGNWALLAGGAAALAGFGSLAYCVSAPVVTVKEGRIVARLLFGRCREMQVAEIESIREVGRCYYLRSDSGAVLKLSPLFTGVPALVHAIQTGIDARHQRTP